MKSKTVAVRLENNPHKYEIRIGSDLLNDCGAWTRKCLSPASKKIALVSNRKVYRLYGDAVKTSLERSKFEVCVFLMKDGERHKNLRTLESVLEFFSKNKLTRADAALALGGGVVGDLTGFAAAIYLRGLAFLQIPTTLLAMIDSSVGGKTAVNTAFGKNLIGAFHQPSGVLIDAATLSTLPRRELVAGFCEAVKQAAIADETLFRQTAEFLENYSPAKFKDYFGDAKFKRALETLIAAQVAFKARIVAQDERENAARRDAKSRKILNFGHTLAHALEKITDYKRFKHGEAVGYGIRFAAALGKNLEIFSEKELKLLNGVLRRVGKLPDARNVSPDELIRAFAFDKKNIGESLEWILLERIGQPVIVENQRIAPVLIRQTLDEILRE